MKENIEANRKVFYQNFWQPYLDCPVFNETDYELSTRYRKTDAPFNELEFRRMAEQFDSIFKKGGPQQQASHLMI
jgi:DNA polymerase-1